LSFDIAFTTGPGQLSTQSLFLSRSVREYLDYNEVYVFLSESEKDSIPNAILEELKSHHTVIQGEIPIPDYPISAKLQALVEAEKRGTSEQTLLLDTDILVFNDFSIPTTSEYYAFPTDIATGQFWLSDDSSEIWADLRENFNLPKPETTVRTFVDNIEVRPYYNAGVVASNSPGFGQKWLQWTREVHEKIPHHYTHADEVALALLSQTSEVGHLSSSFNFPAPYFLWYPSRLNILHYFELPYLTRTLNPCLRGKMGEIGVWTDHNNHISRSDIFSSKYGISRPFRARIGRILKNLR
jgi:hypothetical protein